MEPTDDDKSNQILIESLVNDTMYEMIRTQSQNVANVGHGEVDPAKITDRWEDPVRINITVLLEQIAKSTEGAVFARRVVFGEAGIKMFFEAEDHPYSPEDYAALVTAITSAIFSGPILQHAQVFKYHGQPYLMFRNTQNDDRLLSVDRPGPYYYTTQGSKK